MSSPKWKVPKIYEVHCKHPVAEENIQTLLAGVQLIDEPAPLAALDCKQISSHILHMTLGEGKYHQVKRMIAAISNRVEGLKRVQIGTIELPQDLAEGEWRWLTEDEFTALSQAPKH
jgi:16S rRNA pseudouridine516 synthase